MGASISLTLDIGRETVYSWPYGLYCISAYTWANYKHQEEEEEGGFIRVEGKKD